MAVYRIGVLAVVGLVLVLGGEVGGGGVVCGTYIRACVYIPTYAWHAAHIYIYEPID